MTSSRDYRAGLASTVITPEEPTWAAGYAIRDRPVSETLTELHAKALVLEDHRQKRVLLVTTDLLGLPKQMVESVAAAIGRQFGLPRERILLTASHTHSGPVLRDSLVDIYPMDASQWEQADRYSTWLEGRLVDAVARAMDNVAPVGLSYGLGRAGFGANRREPAAGTGVIMGNNPDGPVDRDVPVLVLTDPRGALRAVLLAYACHNTTLDGYAWCGDYAGFTQADIEAAHPGATAMFVAGCGADSNPQPRREVGLCQRHGRELADAVEHVLAGEMTPITGPFDAAIAHVDLPFDEPPSRGQLQRVMNEGELFEKKWAARRLADLDAGRGSLPPYHYPIQAVRLGDGPTIVALASEVVADYALRIKRELAPANTWVIAYANELFAYLPTRQILAEGGYEADTCVAVYGLPARWSPDVEDLIVTTACNLARQVSVRA